MNRIFIGVTKIKGKRVRAQFKFGNHLTLNASFISNEKRVEEEIAFYDLLNYVKLTNLKLGQEFSNPFWLPSQKEEKRDTRDY